MAAKGSGKDKPAASAAPKKANLLDPHAIKHLLDETASEVVFSRGYAENVTLSNVKMVIGIIIISIALAAQFYPKKFPENRNFLIICIVLYVIFNGLLQFIVYTKEKNTILSTNPLPGLGESSRVASSSTMVARMSGNHKTTENKIIQKSCSIQTQIRVIQGHDGVQLNCLATVENWKP